MASTQRALLLLSAAVLVVVLLTATAQAAEGPKSAFGQAFAEVVVESSLRVNPKGGGRQSRNRKLEDEADSSISSNFTSTSAPLVRSKRQRPPYFWRS